MTEEDYKRVQSIVRRATLGWPLLEQEREDVEQEAALVAWRVGLEPSTRVFWAARDAVIRLTGHRRVAKAEVTPVAEFYPGILSSPSHENEVLERITGDEMLSDLPVKQRQVIEALVLEGHNTMSAATKLGIRDCNIGRRRDAALKTLRGKS